MKRRPCEVAPNRTKVHGTNDSFTKTGTPRLRAMEYNLTLHFPDDWASGPRKVLLYTQINNLLTATEHVYASDGLYREAA